MKLPDEVSKNIVKAAYDEVFEVCGVDLTHACEDDGFMTTRTAKVLAQAMAFSAIINYHNALRKRLLIDGIELGPLEI